jgi:hypothetical protein
MKAWFVAIAIGLLAASAPASAQKIYKCKNDKGEIFYTQSYDPVRCAGGGSQLNDQGLAVKNIPRVKTAEEKAAEKAAAEKQAELDRIAAEQKRSDQVLLMSYANEEDLKRSHEQQLNAIDTSVQTAKLQLENQQRTLADLLAAAAESERAKKPVPENVSKSIATVRAQIETQNQTIVSKESEKKAAQVEFDAKLERYRALVAKQMQGR